MKILGKNTSSGWYRDSNTAGSCYLEIEIAEELHGV